MGAPVCNVDHFPIDSGSKLAEEIVNSRIMDFWGEANVILFNPKQFAYMKKGRSTVTQLLSCFNDLAKSRNKRNPTNGIVLDFLQSVRQSSTYVDLLHRLLMALFSINGFRSFLQSVATPVVNCAANIRHADSGKIRRTSGNNFRAHLVHNVRQRYIHWSFGFHREIVIYCT